VTYDNTNSGVLFKNDKGDNPKRPDYRGSANWNGAEFDISGWVNESKKDGKKFLKLKFEPKKAAPKAIRAPVMDESDPNDDIPF
jgi:uncharacterized protein (DUF736 family)